MKKHGRNDSSSGASNVVVEKPHSLLMKLRALYHQVLSPDEKYYCNQTPKTAIRQQIRLDAQSSKNPFVNLPIKTLPEMPLQNTTKTVQIGSKNALESPIFQDTFSKTNR